MSASNAEVNAVARRGRRSRRRKRRDQRYGRSDISAGTEKNASSDDDLKSEVVAGNANFHNIKDKSNRMSSFFFPCFKQREV